MAFFSAYHLQFLSYFILLLLPLVILVFNRMKTQYKSKFPPGPTGLPIIGNLHQLGNLPHHSLHRLSLKYGNLMYLQLGRVPTLIISSADMATKVLKTQDLSFCSRPPIIALQKFSYGGLDIAFAEYNEHWRQGKKIAMVELFNTGKVQSFRSVREEEVGILSSTINRCCSHGPVNLREMLICLFNNITFRVVFGRRSSKDGECGRSEHQDLLLEMISLMGGFCAGDFFPGMEWINVITGIQGRLDRNFQKMDELMEKEIEAHSCVIESPDQEKKHEDFCSILLRLHRDTTLAVPLTKSYVKGILMVSIPTKPSSIL